MTTVGAVGVNTVNRNVAFGNCKCDCNCEPRKSGGAGKAWASAFVPGLGQMLDGRTGTGIGFLAGTIALIGGTAATVAVGLNKAAGNVKGVSKGFIAGAVALTAAFYATRLADIVSAYRGKQDK